MKLPNEVFVTQWKDTDGEVYLSVQETPEEAIEDDGPTIVGRYSLVSSQRLEKVARAVETKKRHRPKKSA